MAVFLAALAPASLYSQAALDLKVMTFNIRYATNAADWNARRDQVIGIIRNNAPDVVGLQEALRSQLNDLRTGLPAYGELGVGRDDGRTAGEYSAILYRTEAFAVDTSGTYWLSPTPEVPGSRAPGAGSIRINTWARLRHKSGGRTFYFNNSHWDNVSGSARMLAARLIAERIAARPHKDPVIVTCDCNAGVTDSSVRHLLGPAGSPVFRSAYHAIRPNDPQSATYHNFTGATAGQPIDHILFSAGIGVRDASIIRDHVGSQYPSDHFPVLSGLRLDGAVALRPGPRLSHRILGAEDARLVNGRMGGAPPALGRGFSPLFPISP